MNKNIGSNNDCNENDNLYCEKKLEKQLKNFIRTILQDYLQL